MVRWFSPGSPVFANLWWTIGSISVKYSWKDCKIQIKITIGSFVCHYWQRPILINCVMCYYLCVIRWLMRPILALNCLLQIEQERYEEESSVGDALALVSCCARFCSASLILFASYSPAPLLWGLATLYDPVQSVPMTLLLCWSL